MPESIGFGTEVIKKPKMKKIKQIMENYVKLEEHKREVEGFPELNVSHQSVSAPAQKEPEST